jgi:hypothetical protein
MEKSSARRFHDGPLSAGNQHFRPKAQRDGGTLVLSLSAFRPKAVIFSQCQVAQFDCSVCTGEEADETRTDRDDPLRIDIGHNSNVDEPSPQRSRRGSSARRSGKFFKNGCSVEPGLPNMVVSFKALSRSYVAAHTVGTLSVIIAGSWLSD